MKYKVTKKQYNSQMCLICGLENRLGMKASFYEVETGEVVALFTPREEHQSYPGRLHGGMISALLDETIERAIMVTEPDIWGVTVELTLKYRKPVPLNQPLKAIGRVTKNSRKIFEGTAEIVLDDGTVAATASGKFFKMPLSEITDAAAVAQQWQITLDEAEPETITLGKNKNNGTQ
ncbi:MAG TPA: PaaI family thioesterase [Bacillota bacterium]